MEGRTITIVIVVTLVVWVIAVLLIGAARSDHDAIAEQVIEQRQAE